MPVAAETLARASALLTGPGASEVLRAAAAAAGLELTHARLRSVHQRGSRSLSAVHEATLAPSGQDQARSGLLIAHVDVRGLPEAALRLRRDGLEVGVWRFPHDPYLPGLPSAVHYGRVRELLDGLGVAPGEVALRTRAYRPSRRAVVEVTVDGPEAAGRVLYLKVLAPRRVAPLADIHRALADLVPVPRVVGVAADTGILALQALGGRTLRAALERDAPLPTAEELVGLSDRIAGSDLRSDRDPRGFADPSRHVAQLTALLPELGPALEEAAAAAGEVDGPIVPVHGDLHDAQVLVDDGRIVGLLDVDGAGRGLQAHDLGSLVAHLEVVAELEPAAAGRAEALAREVAAVAAERVGQRSLAAAAAGAWLALATGPYRAQLPDWRERTETRVRRAQRWARRTGGD